MFPQTKFISGGLYYGESFYFLSISLDIITRAVKEDELLCSESQLLFVLQLIMPVY